MQYAMFMVCVKLFFVAIVGIALYTMSKMIMTARVAVSKATLDSSCAALHILVLRFICSTFFFCMVLCFYVVYAIYKMKQLMAAALFYHKLVPDNSH